MVYLILQVLGIIGISLVLLWKSVRRRTTNLTNVPSPKSPSWWKGHLIQAFNPHAWEFHESLMREYGSVVRLDGVMGNPHLYTFDPTVMHHALVKDQKSYERLGLQASQLIFGDGLLSVSGDHHRKQKKSLNPVFSIAHMREMLPVFYEVVDKLQNTLLEKAKFGPQEIDMLAWMARTALELIGQSGLGYSFDPMTDDATEHTYSKMIKNLIPVASRLSIVPRMGILPWAMKIGTPRFRRSVVNMLPWKALHDVRDMSDYMWNLSEEIYENKKRAFEEGDDAVARQIGRGKDILSVLMKGNLEASEDQLDEKEIIAQMSTLIFAAMDTTSGALSRVLQLLSTHPDVQDKLRQELLDARRDGEHISYDTLVDLPYLDAICRETLRLFPPVTTLARIATQDTVAPLSQPIVGLDGKKITELVIPKGTHLFISILNSNRNPELWGPDANEWKPERWLSPLPQALIEAHIPGVYSHLMTFNAGGRACIGFKFSQLEMKAVLSMLVSTFKFSSAQKDIFWRMIGITAPFVKGQNDHPRMPLLVSIAEQTN